MPFSRTATCVAIALTLLLAAGTAVAKEYFEMDGDQLVRPIGYRTWVYIGTPLTPNELNNGKAAFPEFHNVYMDPESYQHWIDTGDFRDGTILMKELVSVGSKAAVSGNGYFMGGFLGLEATIKSSKHFPNEPGNWAYFSFTSGGSPMMSPTGGTHGGPLKDKTAAFPTASCNTCHEVSAADDFVFTQYYPVLQAAKGVKKVPENSAERSFPLDSSSLQQNLPPRWAGTAETPAKVRNASAPLDPNDLFEFLKSGKYEKFAAKESAMHPGRGPHTQPGLPVRVFYDKALNESLKKGNSSHPVGATVVKEMYTEDGQLDGWAVMIKTASSTDGGKGWFWYEVTSPRDPSAIASIGNGVMGCVACHAQGADMVVSGYPLR